MLLQRAHGIVFMLLGAVTVVDGWRIAQQAREGANFDAIGPDRYLIALGALMLVAGLWRLLSRQELVRGAETAASDRASGTRPHMVLTTGMLAGFALGVPLLGFFPACLLFLTAQLRLLGRWSWWMSFAVAASTALTFHVAFIMLADMPLPKGYIWN